MSETQESVMDDILKTVRELECQMPGLQKTIVLNSGTLRDLLDAVPLPYHGADFPNMLFGIPFFVDDGIDGAWVIDCSPPAMPIIHPPVIDIDVRWVTK